VFEATTLCSESVVGKSYKLQAASSMLETKGNALRLKLEIEE
jgi:hypothetical protein